MEELHIACATIVQTILDSYIVDEGFVLLGGIAGRYRTTYHDTETIVPETLGELEVVIGATSSFGITGRFHTEAHIHGLTYHIRYLILQERVEGIVHVKASGRISFGHVHAGHEHGYRQLAPFFHTHGIELFLNGCIVRSFEGKGQSEGFQTVGQGDAYIEVHHA